ncbi:MAG: CoA pyrophosphatase [Gemmatimonadales bacterium]
MVMGVTLASVRDKLSRRDPVTADPDGRHQAAVALLLAPGDAGLDFLLIRRAERENDPWSGQMGLPSGRLDEADPGLLATAVRETWEEVGVELDRASVIGQLDDVAPTMQHLPRMLVRPYVFGLTERPPLRPSQEVATAVWAGLGGLLEARVEETIQVREWQRRVTGFKVGSHLVWGMTEHILLSFMGLTDIT